MPKDDWRTFTIYNCGTAFNRNNRDELVADLASHTLVTPEVHAENNSEKERIKTVVATRKRITMSLT